MKTSELIQLQYRTMHRHFTATLKDLNISQLTWVPDANANPIGFLLWHVLRTWDEYFSTLFSSPQVYEKDNWPQKFGFDVGGRGIEGGAMGTGFTPEDVGIVRPDPEILINYFDALLTQLDSYLSTATEKDLGREFIIAWWPDPSSFAGVISHVLTHGMEHIGQAQYVRGLLPG